MQVELKSIQREAGTTFIYVTHDQEEALTISDRIAVMHWGQVLQCDEPEQIFRRPRTCFVASFFRGCNVLEADLVGREDDRLNLRLSRTDVAVAASRDYPHTAGRVPIGLRAENVHIHRGAAGSEVEIPVTVKEIVYRGANVDYLVETNDGQEFVATSTRREPGVEGGQSISVGFAAAEVIPLVEDESGA